MADRARLLAAAALLGSLTACAPTYGPSPPGRGPSLPAEDAAFRAGDFAWSKAPGHNALIGALNYRGSGSARYTCAGATVVLTPETPWSRRRMMVLYKSDQRSALPTDDVRSRTAQAPPGDSNPFVKRATCDNTDRVSFSGLPDGAWYAVTLAKPVAGASGPSVAVMRRVVTRGGRATSFEF
ncbi:hypothetical protein [Phenylobacterium sp.]|uniref:hypothetical protein n=1 Tax=Phenylobacterium sp. TaxID=1871053 RepID=UPI0035658CD8